MYRLLVCNFPNIVISSINLHDIYFLISVVVVQEGMLKDMRQCNEKAKTIQHRCAKLESELNNCRYVHLLNSQIFDEIYLLAVFSIGCSIPLQ